MTQLLNYSHYGQGEPLLILHGLFGSGKNWQSLAKQLAGHFSVYTVDLRNHGESFHDPVMNYEVMAGDVHKLIIHLGIIKAQVIGHSMGGKVAMLLAQRYPDQISDLVVADIAPVDYKHSHSSLIEPLLEIDLDQIGSRAEVDKALAIDIQEPVLRGFLLQNLARDGDSWRWKVNWQAIQQQMEALISFPVNENIRLSLPTLFIRGENSDYIDNRGIAAIQKHFINAEIETIENAGHWLHAEQPGRFLEIVKHFLIRKWQ